MSLPASFEHLLAYLVYSIPALVLIVLLFLLHARRTQTPAQAPDETSAPRVMQPLATGKGGEGRATMPPQGVATGVAEGSRHTGGASQVSDDSRQLREIEARLESAEEADDQVAMAELNLKLGHARLAAGLAPAALDAFRSAAGLAALNKLHEIHAAARLELADAALRAGDAIGACEHWQIARMAFMEKGMRTDGARVDKHMRANGCPTDWVLTDF